MTQTKHEEYYDGLKSETIKCLESSMKKDFSPQHAEIHHAIIDFEQWLSIIISRPEGNLFKYAIREFHSSLIAVLLSQYRHAFMSLRLFLELSIATIFYSANEYLLRRWYSGQIDLNWSHFINSDNGVFSKNFAYAFTPALSETSKHYSAISEQVYRECSEFVHGSCTSFKTLPEFINFDETTFKSWFEKAKTVKLIVAYALTVRYLGIIDKSHVITMEPIILDELGHLEQVRIMINARKGEQI